MRHFRPELRFTGPTEVIECHFHQPIVVVTKGCCQYIMIKVLLVSTLIACADMCAYLCCNKELVGVHVDPPKCAHVKDA